MGFFFSFVLIYSYRTNIFGAPLTPTPKMKFSYTLQSCAAHLDKAYLFMASLVHIMRQKGRCG